MTEEKYDDERLITGKPQPSPSVTVGPSIPEPPRRGGIGGFLDRFRKHTASSQETSAEQLRTWEGLIFDDPNELRQAIGEDNIFEEEAGALVGIHLWDEYNITNAISELDEDTSLRPDIIREKIRDYRQKNRLTLSFSESDLIGIFHYQDSSLVRQLQGVDLADWSAVGKIIDKIDSDEEGGKIWRVVREYVDERIKHDLTAKAESEGESWNAPLSEAGPSLLAQLQEKIPSLRISPEKKRELLNELKQFGKTLSPKDWRELGAISARVAAEFVPGLGLAMMATNMAATGIKEARTIRRVGREKTDPATSTSREYLKQTTWGKILFEDSPSRLYKFDRLTAGLTGLATSLSGLIAAEGVDLVVQVPGAKGVAKTSLNRAFFQYLTPRVLNFIAEKGWRKIGRLETEEEQKEWVDLALSSSRLTTIAFTSAFTAAAVAPMVSEAVSEIDTSEIQESIESTLTSARQSLESIDIEKAVENLRNVPLVKGIIETTQAAQTPTPEPTIQVVEGLPEGTPVPEVTTTPTLPPTEGPILEGQVSPFESGEHLGGEQPPEETQPEISTGEPEVSTSQAVTLLESLIPMDTDGDGLPDVWKAEFDVDKDGQPDSYVKYDPEGKPIEAVMADGRHLFLDENSKGIPGLQTKFLELHHELTPDEAATLATRAFAEGITADNTETVKNYPIAAYATPPSLEVDESLEINKEGPWKYNNQGLIVTGKLEDGRNLIFDFNSEGEPGLIVTIANENPSLTPDQVGIMAHLAYQKGMHPIDINPDSLTDLENLIPPEPIIAPDIRDLERGQGFDSDNDGKEDSWWLVDKDTGETEAGHLPDESTLILGEEGGPTGVIQEYITDYNPNLSPNQVAETSTRIVDTQEFDNIQEAKDGLIGPKVPEIIENINLDVARYSLSEWFSDKFGLTSNKVYDIIKKMGFETVRNDQVVNLAPGADALRWLNVRVKIDEGVYPWDWSGWNDWLKEKGVIN